MTRRVVLIQLMVSLVNIFSMMSSRWTEIRVQSGQRAACQGKLQITTDLFNPGFDRLFRHGNGSCCRVWIPTTLESHQARLTVGLIKAVLRGRSARQSPGFLLFEQEILNRVSWSHSSPSPLKSSQFSVSLPCGSSCQEGHYRHRIWLCCQ